MKYLTYLKKYWLTCSVISMSDPLYISKNGPFIVSNVLHSTNNSIFYSYCIFLSKFWLCFSKAEAQF